MVVGPPGSGKTTLAMQMAFTVARTGHQVLILTALSEPNTKLIEHVRGFTFVDDTLLGTSDPGDRPPAVPPQGLPATADAVIAEVQRIRPRLVMLDGFRGVQGASNTPQAAREFLYKIGTALSVLGTTLLVTSEAVTTRCRALSRSDHCRRSHRHAL